MGSKPESTYITRVNRHLDTTVYREKMANPYRGGTPDVYYEGNAGVLWVEYKWYDAIPLVVELVDKKLSRLQQFWLQRCHGNDQPCAVIVGSPEGGVIYPGASWREALPRNQFIERTLDAKEVANWIYAQTMK